MQWLKGPLPNASTFTYMYMPQPHAASPSHWPAGTASAKCSHMRFWRQRGPPPLAHPTCIMRTTVAASLTLRAKQVMQSREAAAGTRPWLLSLPTEGLMPTQPFRPAGIRPAGGTCFLLSLVSLLGCLVSDSMLAAELEYTLQEAHGSSCLWSACLGAWCLTVRGQLSRNTPCRRHTVPFVSGQPAWVLGV